MKPAIVVPAITQFVAEARELVAALHEAEGKVQKVERLLGETREAAQMRRLEVGHMLLRHRAQLPKRGSKENGWGAYLEAIEMDEATAWRYMKLAENPSDATFQLKDSDPEPCEIPPPTDADAPSDLAGDIAPEVEIDRDTWCTPKWLTDAIGKFDLDPCANERSHVNAGTQFRLEDGKDGLDLAKTIGRDWRVFLNPPYSDVMPWVQAYAHTRFCFLLKFDPSTKWFAELLKHTAVVLLPRGTRVQFEAPENVPPEKALANQFPHALFYALESDVSDAIRELCWPGWEVQKAGEPLRLADGQQPNEQGGASA